MKNINVVIFTAIFILSLFSCTKEKGKTDSNKKVLRIGILTFPKTLNPAYVTDETSTILINKVFDSLYSFDSNGDPVSRVVENESVTVHNDSIDIQIILKNDIYFSDGKLLDSDDIIETIKLLKKKKYISPYRQYVNAIKKVKKNGKFDLKIFFHKKNANWRNYLTFKILNSNEIRNIDLNDFRQKIFTGTGPLKFDKIKRPSKIELSYNKYFAKGKGVKKIYSKVIYYIIAYSHHSSLKLMNNEIDIVDFQPEDVLAYHSTGSWQKGFELYKYKKFGYTYMAFNLMNTKVSKKVRKILYEILYNRGFLKKFLNNRGEIIKTPFLLLNNEVENQMFDISPLNKEVTLSLLSNTQSFLRKEFSLFLSMELRKYNIKLNPVFVEHAIFLECLRNRNFEIALSGFLLDIDYDMNDVLASKGYFNYPGYKSLNMDRLLNMGLMELDEKKRKQIYMKANKQWVEDIPILPLFNLYYYIGVSERVKKPGNVTSMIGSSGDFLQNIEDWIYDAEK